MGLHIVFQGQSLYILDNCLENFQEADE